jgi:hypothetical protein
MHRRCCFARCSSHHFIAFARHLQAHQLGADRERGADFAAQR